VGTTKEQRPSTGAKVRGALPGESWREYVSPGAEKAYDGPLRSNRTEAHKLARKGRLVAAHKREKAAYKIRVRGYDRKHRGENPVEKAYTSRSVALGPVKYATKKLQLRKPTKGEERAEQLRAVLGGVGTIKLAAGAGAGALVTDAVKDAKDKSKKATVAVKSKIAKEPAVTKSLEPRDLVDIQKDWVGTAGKIIGGLGAAAGAAAGAKKLIPQITKPLKRKALKYAGIGAAGAAGTVAAGTAVGNTLSPR
jgi:hypothetical protein